MEIVFARNSCERICFFGCADEIELLDGGLLLTAGILVADIVLVLTEEFPSEELLRGGDAPRLRDVLPVYVGIRVGVAACRVGAAELVERRGATVIGCSADIVGIFEPGAPFLAGDALDLAGEVPALVGVLDGDNLALAGDPLPLSTAALVVALVVGFEVALAVDDFIRNANG